MNTKVHEFEISGGNDVKHGKSNWPDMINIRMDKYHAWDLVNSILAQLERGDDNILLQKMGKLDFDVPED